MRKNSAFGVSRAPFRQLVGHQTCAVSYFEQVLLLHCSECFTVKLTYTIRSTHLPYLSGVAEKYLSKIYTSTCFTVGLFVRTYSVTSNSAAVFFSRWTNIGGTCTLELLQLMTSTVTGLSLGPTFKVIVDFGPYGPLGLWA